MFESTPTPVLEVLTLFTAPHWPWDARNSDVQIKDGASERESAESDDGAQSDSAR
jgi:hypothetical protein